MELREKIARKHWLASLRRVLRAQGKALSYIDSWKETDFDKQELIDKEPYYTFANQILALIKAAGYVKLSDDQSYPSLTLDTREFDDKSNFIDVIEIAVKAWQFEMLKAGFRRVEL